MTLRPETRAAAWPFAATLLLSSTLLFIIQPMFAKMALPRLGGSPGVWNTCMVFFQACLLLGYAYAHVATKFPPRRQIVIHLLVLLLPLLVLPIALPASTPPAEANPTAWLLVLLTVTVGLPFFVVSATAPLLQKWYAHAQRDADPYFLYAASNIGSMGALLAYPLIIEPNLRVATQARWWSFGYGAHMLMIAACGISMWRVPAHQHAPLSPAKPGALAPGRKLRWILLAFIPSSYLLGVTTFMTTDIAAVPLIWVIPLALYLLSFVLVFARRPPIKHNWMIYALPTSVLLTVTFLAARTAHPIALVLGLHLISFFIVAMVCHGEIARTRPPAEHLTQFYLLMSVGGVLGGAFNALLAPILFTNPLEYSIAIFLACFVVPSRRSIRGQLPHPVQKIHTALDVIVPVVVFVLAWFALKMVPARATGAQTWALAFVLLAPAVLVCLGTIERTRRFALSIAALLIAAAFAPPPGSRVLATRRSFFGVHRIMSTGQGEFSELFHGTTLHGTQRADLQGRPIDPLATLTYYHPRGPIGEVMRSLPDNRPQNIAVIGLGVGSIAAYASAQQKLTYFEIDPVVRDIAEHSGYFSFLAAARQRGADVNIVLGDARLTLAGAPDRAFDLIVLDAFSGDAIPTHLLTRECFALARRKLSPRGGVAIHISNMYLDLRTVIANLAADAGWICMYRDDRTTFKNDDAERKLGSQWAIVAKSPDDLGELATDPRWITLPRDPTREVWTDDFSNILSVIRWRARAK